MDIVVRRERATATQVREDLPNPPSNAAVRALLRSMEDKGHLRHEAKGNRYVYRPARPLHLVRRAALERVLHTFFGGSILQTMTAVLELDDSRLDATTRDALLTVLSRAGAEPPPGDR